MASPARLSWQISIFPKKIFLVNFKLWEIVFMGFLTHRNLPETLGGHFWKIEKWIFGLFLDGQIFSHFSKFLICYNGYQGLSWTRISSRFLFYIKSYTGSTIQILKIIFLRLRGEKSLMIKRCFFDVRFERRILCVCDFRNSVDFIGASDCIDGGWWWMVVDGGGWWWW